MTDLSTKAPADWYRDPTDPAHIRYWDGTQYTLEAHWEGTAWAECGPGWWRAADHLMYPPEHRPPVQVPPTIQPTGIPGTWLSAASVAETVAPEPQVASHATSPAKSPGIVRRLSIRRAWAVPVVALVCAVAVVAGVTPSVVGSGSGWTDPTLHVVGSPVTVDGMVIVLNVQDKRLELSGIKAGNGSVVWRHPFSASNITPGVAFSPTVLDDTVLGLAPAGTSDDPSVTVEGLDPTTGKVLWSLPQPLILTDAPAVCAGGAYFCVAAVASATTTGLVLVDPATGGIGGVVGGPERNMAVAQPGTNNEGDLWETSDSTSTFMQVSSTGAPLWTKTVASLFGGSQYDPNYGWDFLVDDGLDVGSVGTALVGTSEPLDNLKTLGISTATGTVRWSDPGEYFCGGGLQFLTANVICRYSGRAQSTGTSITMAGVTMSLEGVNTSTGAITWSKAVLDPQGLSLGTNVAFVDGSHLVVQLPTGNRVVLDVQNGQTVPVIPGEVFWCEQNPMYNVTTPQGGSADGQRQSAPVFRACSANGSPVNTIPTTSPDTVGVTAGGLFVWPTPGGLQAASLQR